MHLAQITISRKAFVDFESHALPLDRAQLVQSVSKPNSHSQRTFQPKRKRARCLAVSQETDSKLTAQSDLKRLPHHTHSGVQAVVLDLDGTLCNSESLSSRSVGLRLRAIRVSVCFRATTDVQMQCWKEGLEGALQPGRQRG